MPLTSPTARLRRLAREVTGLGTPGGAGNQMLVKGIDRAVRGLLKAQFAEGVDPSGQIYVPKKGGKPAFVSRRLPSVFTSEREDGAAKFVGRVKRDWLSAHQEGFVFKPRTVGEHKNYLTFDKRGRLIKSSRAINKKGNVTRGVYQVFAKAHAIGQRVLPKRPLIPEGILPARWEKAIAESVTAVMHKWHEQASK